MFILNPGIAVMPVVLAGRIVLLQLPLDPLGQEHPGDRLIRDVRLVGQTSELLKHPFRQPE